MSFAEDPTLLLSEYASPRRIAGFTDIELLHKICQGESGFDPLIDNINSSARGWYQHMGKYWIRAGGGASRPERWFPNAPPAVDGVVANIFSRSVQVYGAIKLYYHEGGARHWAIIYNYTTKQFRDFLGVPAWRWRQGPDPNWRVPAYREEFDSYDQADPFFRPRKPQINANGDRDFRGDRKVSTIQEQLNAHGVPTGVDGLFGNGTKGSVADFQGRKGLAIDGIVGPQTREALGLDPVDPEPGPPGLEERLTDVERLAAQANQRSVVNRGAITEMHGWPVS